MAITIESLRAVPYLKTENIGGGRTINLMPLWDGERWRMWVETSDGLVELKMVDSLEGDYVATRSAKPSDLFIPFVHLMWQQASWPEICPLISAISDDFHNMGTSAAKLKHFFDSRGGLPPGAASRFVYTEIEYLVMLCRTVFDLLQEMISITWQKHVSLNDHDADSRRRGANLPETFSRIVLHEKMRTRNTNEIEDRFGLPRTLAEQYSEIAPFFSQLRSIRDAVVHGGKSVGQIFDTEKGFCVSPQVKPFSSFKGWRPDHHYNVNLVSILPWIADMILQTINACNSLMDAFAAVIRLPPEVAPGYTVFVRGPHNVALAKLLEVHSGSSAWWD